jgi:hypothetical protein
VVFGESALHACGKGRQLQACANWASVSDSYFGRLSAESPNVSGVYLQIPVLGRLAPETRFDLHCAVGLATNFAQAISAGASWEIRTTKGVTAQT